MAKYIFYKKRLLFKKRVFDVCCFLFIAFIVSIASLYFTNKDFAIELRQVTQPKPNIFFIGIDVSQTLRPDILADFKDALIWRLQNFIGEKKVSYHIYIFGLPGCEKDAIADMVSTKSPENPASFSQRVGERIREISIARRTKADGDRTPLTTPLFYFLEKILTERAGGRVIIFSDLVNDDEGCQKQYPFPLRAITKFGLNKEGQIIFFYSTPYLRGRYDTPELRERLLKKQQDFIFGMQRQRDKGKVRTFFYHIPDDPQKRLNFLRSKLESSIPATMFEIIWERVSKMIDTVIGAVRG